eukprot:s7126_g4.t1
MPEEWADQYLIPIPKKGDLSFCKKWKGILLASILGKVFGKIVNARIYQHSEKHGLMPETQAGFRAGRSTLDMVFVLRMAQEIVRAKDHPLFVVFVDLVTAYDSVVRDGLWRILRVFVDLVTAYDSVVRDGLWRILRIKGVPENLVALLKTFYEQKMRAYLRKAV